MNPNEHLKFVVKKAIVNRTNKKVEYATICLVNEKTGVCLPHPVSDFIKTVYANDKNYNTQKAPAEEIKKFLNWLLIENYSIYRLKSFEELGIHHGVDYLNYLSEVKQLKRNTVKSVNRYLTSFYDFLYKRNILPKHMKLEYIETPNHQKVLVSPFLENGATLPSKSLEKEKITAFPDNQLITVFLETAERVAPEITFGIYLQMFGGLRRGEVVNLTRSDIRIKGDYGNQGLSVMIKDRPDLFLRLSDSSKTQPKRERNQPIQIVDYFPQIYKNFIERWKVDDVNNPNQALFVDNNGKPMSGAVYEKRFMKVKKHFLKYLEKIHSPHVYYLKSASWGTHIGRGIYTNLMASLVSSPNELAILRGDKTLNASLTYMSMMKVKNEVQQGLEDMFKSEESNR